MSASLLILGAALIVASGLTVTRSISGNAAELSSAARILALATVAQAAHFVEETATGFPERMPALFGSPPIPLAWFVVFNVAWLLTWAGSVPGVRAGRRIAFLPAWFLAIAGTLNGVLHPAIALASGRYFPGLISSPMIGIAGALLLVRLFKATRAASQANRQ